MAIDGDKLVRRIEQRFGVRISHEEVERIETIGHLCDHLGKRAREVRQRPCVTAWVFYRVRRALLDELPLERRHVRPSTRLAELIPPRSRRRAWRALEEEFEFDLPDLVAPPALRYGLVAFAVVSLIVLVAFVAATSSYDYLIVLPFVWAIGLGLALLFSRPFARGFPSGLVTVADVVRRVAPFEGLPRDATEAEAQGWIFEQVRNEVAVFTGVEAGTLSRRTHFIRDLKVR